MGSYRRRARESDSTIFRSSEVRLAAAVRSGVEVYRGPGKFVRLSRLRKLRECEQVAAVCYRVRGDGIEFLLVRTRGSGRWTFPKGSAEPGLTHAQAAALEAFEEAGVHGRIEEASFVRYVRRVARQKSGARHAEDTAVNAHLCEVSRLSAPQESRRNRTWFSAQDARQRLREGRQSEDGAVFARVIDRAVERILQLRSESGIVNGGRDDAREDNGRRGYVAEKDGLQKVRFEAFEGAYRGLEEAWFASSARPLPGKIRGPVPIADVHRREFLQCEVLQFAPAREKKAKP
jgi:8-oxo-dGTP pyrophosphatase MutT (NUDIX family)